MPDKQHPGDRSLYYAATAIEAIEVIEEWKLNFCLGNVVKYISRLNRKPGEDPIEALEKASWYLQREIEERKRRSANSK